MCISLKPMRQGAIFPEQCRSLGKKSFKNDYFPEQCRSYLNISFLIDSIFRSKAIHSIIDYLYVWVRETNKCKDICQEQLLI